MERNHEHDRIKEHDIMKHGNQEQRNAEHRIGPRVVSVCIKSTGGSKDSIWKDIISTVQYAQGIIILVLTITSTFILFTLGVSTVFRDTHHGDVACISFKTVSLSPVIILIIAKQAWLSIFFFFFFLGGGGRFQNFVRRMNERKVSKKCNEVALFALEEDMIFSESKTG